MHNLNVLLNTIEIIALVALTITIFLIFFKKDSNKDKSEPNYKMLNDIAIMKHVVEKDLHESMNLVRNSDTSLRRALTSMEYARDELTATGISTANINIAMEEIQSQLEDVSGMFKYMAENEDWVRRKLNEPAYRDQFRKLPEEVLNELETEIEKQSGIKEQRL